jgi:hypothetical protein
MFSFSSILFLGFFGLLKMMPQVHADCPYVPNSSNMNISISIYQKNYKQPTDYFRIVQYNVEWLFVDYYAPMDCPGEHCTWKNESEALIHLDYVANIIGVLQPDYINLCEVEGCDELNMLIGELDANESYKYTPYLVQGTDTATGQNVGILTTINPLKNLFRTEEKLQYPLANSTCGYTGSPGTTGVSKHYITEYVWYSRPIVVIGLHLLAYPDDTLRCVEREVQAQIIQNVVASYIQRSYEVLVLGDFNDFDAEIPDLNNNKPISRVLDILKGLDGSLANSYRLYNVGEQLDQTERWTDWWDKNADKVSSPDEFSMIDHILVTAFLQSKIRNVSVYHGYDEYEGKYNSDHYPVVLDMEWIG